MIARGCGNKGDNTVEKFLLEVMKMIQNWRWWQQDIFVATLVMADQLCENNESSKLYTNRWIICCGSYVSIKKIIFGAMFKFHKIHSHGDVSEGKDSSQAVVAIYF